MNINIPDTGKDNNRRWQATGGQRVQRANSAGRFRHGSPRKSLPSGKSAGRCGHRPLHIPRSSSMKSNISGEIIGNRRWQATGGQRVQRANFAGRFRHGSPRSCTSQENPSTSFAGPPPLSGEAYLAPLHKQQSKKATPYTGVAFLRVFTGWTSHHYFRWNSPFFS